MPRTGGGVYYLPSPPSPLVPGTLAAAEDLNTIFQDIATALTGSMAANGSTPLTGPLNLNGQNISGVGTLGAVNVNASGWATLQNLNVPGDVILNYLGGPLNANNQNITGVGTLTAGYANITNQNIPGELVVTNLAAGALVQQLNANNQNIVNVGELSTNTLWINAFLSDVNANGHNVVNVATIWASQFDGGNFSGGQITASGISCTWLGCQGDLWATTVRPGWPGTTDYTLSTYSGGREIHFQGNTAIFRWNTNNAHFEFLYNNNVVAYIDFNGHLWTQS